MARDAPDKNNHPEYFKPMRTSLAGRVQWWDSGECTKGCIPGGSTRNGTSRTTRTVVPPVLERKPKGIYKSDDYKKEGVESRQRVSFPLASMASA